MTTNSFGRDMSNRGFVKGILLIIILVLLGVVGYLTKDYLPFGFTNIAELTSRPKDFEGQQVKVKGKVTDTLKIPFVDSRSYEIDDGTGVVTVVTNLSLPRVGDKIAIVAIGRNTAIIGDASIGFRLQEVKVLPKFSQGLE
jgi:hypothetical protein